MPIHNHGQKLWGGPLFENFKVGVIKISKKISQICDNHKGYQNQLQNLIKNIEKVHNFVKNHENFAIFPQSCNFPQIFGKNSSRGRGVAFLNLLISYFERILISEFLTIAMLSSEKLLSSPPPHTHLSFCTALHSKQRIKTFLWIYKLSESH